MDLGEFVFRVRVSFENRTLSGGRSALLYGSVLRGLVRQWTGPGSAVGWTDGLTSFHHRWGWGLMRSGRCVTRHQKDSNAQHAQNDLLHEVLLRPPVMVPSLGP